MQHRQAALDIHREEGMSGQYIAHRGDGRDKAVPAWNLFINKLVYLPGALVMIYGFWLSLSV